MASNPRIYFSVGEPSGDLHGANLISALRAACPGITCEGFGGERMVSAGFDMHFPLCQSAVMGLLAVFKHIPTFAGLLNQATEHFRGQRPDAVVLVDYPGFNWWMARRAKGLGIPVFYFVPPQIWAWASYRVKKMRKFVDHVLCTLPFEKPWYREHGIDAHYIGHPYFDALQQQTLDTEFLTGQQSRPGTIIGILPGSRRAEIENNFATQMRAAAYILQRHPECRFLVAGFKREHAAHFTQVLTELFPAPDRATRGNLETGLHGKWSLPVKLCLGRTPEIIHLAHSCIAVSGSVSLELLYAHRPAVIIYRGGLLTYSIYRLFRKVEHISLVNLLAERVLYPEVCSFRYEPEKIAENLLPWLDEPARHERLQRELVELCATVAQPGACVRAADYILSTIQKTRVMAA